MATDFYSLPAIGERLRTQDNRCTADPIFLVQQRRRDYGYDPAYSDDPVWLDTANDSIEATWEEHAELEAGYQLTGEEPDGWTRTAYVDRWEFVTACFTEAAALRYIEANAHNLTDPRVFAASGYRNPEWKAVRAMLMGLSDGD